MVKSRKQKSIEALKSGVLAAEKTTENDRPNIVKQLVNAVLTIPDEKKRAKALRKIIYNHTEIQKLLEENPKLLVADVERSMYELAAGCTITDETIIVSGGRKTVKTVTKQLPPNQAAIEFILTNKADYSARPESASSDANGKIDEIMEALRSVK